MNKTNALTPEQIKAMEADAKSHIRDWDTPERRGLINAAIYKANKIILKKRHNKPKSNIGVEIANLLDELQDDS